ncbi:MAG: DNA methyltransferase [Candidatus Sumerlaeota bacterium]|nr:DNA methyltransferase [Candidatus Sumerlaeota bacterium]
MPVDPVQEYLKEIQKHLSAGIATEHTYRSALGRLLESLAEGVTATNEPKRARCGAPDFVVTRGQTPLGYVEAKDIGKNLDEAEKTEQMDRYREGLSNLILTDYLEFRWYRNGEFAESARLARVGKNGKLEKTRDAETELQKVMGPFFSFALPMVRSPRELADRMAALARILRDVIVRAFEDEDAKTGSLHSQFEAFRRVLLHDLEAAPFADMYAQTICYGLFAACCNHNPARGAFTREAAAFDLPETNPFLREMFGHIAGPKLDSRLTWAVDHLTELLRRADMPEILRDFGKRTRHEDPVVHFYETFLAAYDPKMREARGVYYTPEPVVSYIVRSVDQILKRDLKIADGLASAAKYPICEVVENPLGGTRRVKTGETHRVLILDPAAGTGTFLHGVVDQIYDQFTKSGTGGLWDSYVSEHLLPRLFGFELLMAPYAVAHMKLGIQLAEMGYTFHSGERLRVYLTNTLEEAFEHSELPLFANLIAEEANAAGRVKNEAPVMVILGNPPYSGHSENKSEWIADLLRGHDRTSGKPTADYFKVDGKPLGERNPKWLNDDYVKFIRFAQWRIERTGYGILAFICNNGYLDNPTFRGMRQSLMETFDDIYILDLHGNSKKKETAPDGSKDENVFDIQQGVAIGIFVRHIRYEKKGVAAVHHAHLWGPREVWQERTDGARELAGGKYHSLQQSNVVTTKWTALKPDSPFYLFAPLDPKLIREYNNGWKVTDAMPVYSLGIATARDDFAVAFRKEELWARIEKFVGMTAAQGREAYQLGPDTRDWKAHLAQRDLKQSGPSKDLLHPIQYRPFDVRITYYTGNSRGFLCMPRAEVMAHMLAGPNIGLSTTRGVEIGRGFEHVFCSSNLIQLHTVSIKEVNYLFPLYLYPNGNVPDMLVRHEDGRRPNLACEFVENIGRRLGMSFIPDGQGARRKTFGPEDVFHYMYAVFHSPTYRARYAAFLKIDFPRLPLTSRLPLFRALCGLGERLKKLHLMSADIKPSTTFPKTGDNTVDKPRYDDEHGRVYINKTQYFGGVPRRAWEFHVGGYQVCHKWLKDRKGRPLSYDDLTHYSRIVAALDETINIMAKIDKTIIQYGGWPIQ